jgi:hypothetical protein
MTGQIIIHVDGEENIADDEDSWIEHDVINNTEKIDENK